MGIILYETLHKTYEETTENSEPSVQPEIEPELDDIPDFVQPLFDLVNSNGEEIRAWPWLGGAEAPLRTCIYEHPRAQTYLKPEDVPVMMTEILQAIAQRPETQEESNEAIIENHEDEPPAEYITEEVEQEKHGIIQGNETEIKAREKDTPRAQRMANLEDTGQKGNETKGAFAQTIPIAENAGEQVKKETEVIKIKEASTAKPEQPPAMENNEGAVAKVETAPSPSKNISELSAKVNPVSHASKKSVSKASIHNSNKPEKSSVDERIIHKFASSQAATESLRTQEPKVDMLDNEKLETEQEPEAKQLITTLEKLQPSEGVEVGNEDSAVLDKLGIPETPPTKDTLSAVFGINGENDNQEEVGEIEEEPIAVTFEQQIGSIGIADFTEIILLPEVDIEEADYYLNSQPKSMGREERVTLVQEQIIIAETEIEGVEAVLNQLVEQVGNDKLETSKEINEILDKIVEVSKNEEDKKNESGIDELEIQEEFEELFIELLDAMGIDRTPELTESLTNLAINLHLREKIKKKAEEDEGEEPQDSGTHEVITQMLIGISTAKELWERFYEIGKSALQLSFKTAA
jgi:hypothetical protein